MLSPLSEPDRRRARFKTYDLEWYPGSMQLRLIGVRDAVRYRSYREPDGVGPGLKGEALQHHNRQMVQRFCEGELTKSSDGDWFYAHAGGLADAQFLLEHLVDEPEYRLEIAFSGSSAVIVKIRRGRHRWVLVDSLFTLKDSLKKIGERLGKDFHKGEVSWSAPIDILEAYNEQDCAILYEGLKQFEDVLIDQGSELKMTLASCAMRLFRRRYLKEPIPTHAKLNMILRPAYVGGRVEVFYKKPVDDWLNHGALSPGYYYDVNSCYPWAMTQPMPERLLCSKDRLPTARDGEVCYFLDAEWEVPEDTQVPALPYVHGGSLYFPVGRFRGTYCGPEVERAMECGAKLTKIYCAYYYRPFHDLGDFARDVYRLRMRSKGFHNYVFKILNNSCYGKFGERTDKQAIYINPTEARLDYLTEAYKRSREDYDKGERDRPLREVKRYQKGALHMITPGVFLAEQVVPVHNAHVPIAAYVTSHARALLHRHLLSTSVLPYYCDTDGFMLPPEGREIVCEHGWGDCPIEKGGNCAGCLLGGLKREKVVSDSMFFAPKLYYILEETGTDMFRAKGFGGICDCLLPLGCRPEVAEDGGEVRWTWREELDRETGAVSRHRVWEGRGVRWVSAGDGYKCPGCGLGRGDKPGRQAFERLIAGKAAVANRMLRIRELFGRGETHPAEEADERQVVGSKPKRCFNSDGTSRPWDVRELIEEMNR